MKINQLNSGSSVSPRRVISGSAVQANLTATQAHPGTLANYAQSLKGREDIKTLLCLFLALEALPNEDKTRGLLLENLITIYQEAIKSPNALDSDREAISKCINSEQPLQVNALASELLDEIERNYLQKSNAENAAQSIADSFVDKLKELFKTVEAENLQNKVSDTHPIIQILFYVLRIIFTIAVLLMGCILFPQAAAAFTSMALPLTMPESIAASVPAWFGGRGKQKTPNRQPLFEKNVLDLFNHYSGLKLQENGASEGIVSSTLATQNCVIVNEELEPFLETFPAKSTLAPRKFLKGDNGSKTVAPQAQSTIKGRDDTDDEENGSSDTGRSSGGPHASKTDTPPVAPNSLNKKRDTSEDADKPRDAVLKGSNRFNEESASKKHDSSKGINTSQIASLPEISNKPDEESEPLAKGNASSDTDTSKTGRRSEVADEPNKENDSSDEESSLDDADTFKIGNLPGRSDSSNEESDSSYEDSSSDEEGSSGGSKALKTQNLLGISNRSNEESDPPNEVSLADNTVNQPVIFDADITGEKSISSDKESLPSHTATSDIDSPPETSGMVQAIPFFQITSEDISDSQTLTVAHKQQGHEGNNALASIAPTNANVNSSTSKALNHGAGRQSSDRTNESNQLKIPKFTNEHSASSDEEYHSGDETLTDGASILAYLKAIPGYHQIQTAILEPQANGKNIAQVLDSLAIAHKNSSAAEWSEDDEIRPFPEGVNPLRDSGFESLGDEQYVQQEKIRSLKQKIDALGKQLVALQETHAEEQHAAQEEIDALGKQLVALRETHAEEQHAAQEEIDALGKQLVALQETHAEEQHAAQEEVDALGKQLVALQETRAEEQHAAQEEVDALGKQLVALRETHAEEQHAAQEQVDVLNSKLLDMRAAIQTIIKNIENSGKEEIFKAEKIISLSDSSKISEEKNSDLEETVILLSASLEALDNERLEVLSKNSDLEETVILLRASLDKLEDEKSEQEETINSLSNRIEILEDKESKQGGRINSLSASLETSENQNFYLEKSIEEMEKEKSVLQGKVQSFSETIEKLEVEKSQITTKNNNISVEKVDLENAVSNLIKENLILKENKAQITSEALSSVNRQMVEKVVENRKLQALVDHWKSEADHKDNSLIIHPLPNVKKNDNAIIEGAKNGIRKPLNDAIKKILTRRGYVISNYVELFIEDAVHNILSKMVVSIKFMDEIEEVAKFSEIIKNFDVEKIMKCILGMDFEGLNSYKLDNNIDKFFLFLCERKYKNLFDKLINNKKHVVFDRIINDTSEEFEFIKNNDKLQELCGIMSTKEFCDRIENYFSPISQNTIGVMNNKSSEGFGGIINLINNVICIEELSASWDYLKKISSELNGCKNIYDLLLKEVNDVKYREDEEYTDYVRSKINIFNEIYKVIDVYHMNKYGTGVGGISLGMYNEKEITLSDFVDEMIRANEYEDGFLFESNDAIHRGK